MMNRFQTLLSISTCASATRLLKQNEGERIGVAAEVGGFLKNKHSTDVESTNRVPALDRR